MSPFLFEKPLSQLMESPSDHTDLEPLLASDFYRIDFWEWVDYVYFAPMPYMGEAVRVVEEVEGGGVWMSAHNVPTFGLRQTSEELEMVECMDSYKPAKGGRTCPFITAFRAARKFVF